jgi:hypothetical protein
MLKNTLFLIVLSLLWAFVHAQNVSTTVVYYDSSTSNSTESASIGDFLFDKPNVQSLWASGTNMTIKWHIQPKSIPNPPNITLQVRYGSWPSVSNWTFIAKQVSADGEYIWAIPDTFFAASTYVMEISTPQLSPLIRTHVMGPFQIFRPDTAIGGKLYLPSSADKSTSISTNILSLGLILSVTFLAYQQML